MARPRSDIAPRIVHAARARFLHDGVDGASQRQIARNARTNVGMIYYYFPTKDALFLAVVEEAYSKILADIEAALVQDVPVAERLTRLYARFGRLSDEEVDVIRIVVREVLVSSERRHKLIERFSRGHLPLVIAMIAEGLQSGELRRVEHPAVILMSIFTLGIAPQIARRFLGPEMASVYAFPDGERMARYASDVLLHGIAASAPKP